MTNRINNPLIHREKNDLLVAVLVVDVVVVVLTVELVPVPVYGVVELGTVIPVVVTDGFAVVVDTAAVVTFGIIVVVLDVDMPVILL